MRKLLYTFLMGSVVLIACNDNSTKTTTSAEGAAIETHSQAGVQDSTSQPNVVQVAINSKDHSTLVEAVKAADLVNSLSNAGPFTIFAPTNAAFEKLPKATLESLMKPENKDALVDALQYHAYVGVLQPTMLADGQSFNMVDGKNISIKMVDGKPLINGKANVIATVPASNGIVYVIDEVLQPQ